MLVASRRQVLGMLAAGPIAGSRPSVAQAIYPNRNIRFVVPFPAGGGTDVFVRTIAPSLAEKLGQSIVIENKPGASGIPGSADIARSAADGYHVLICFDTHAVNHLISRTMPYETFKAFDPVSLLGTTPMTLIVSQRLGISSVAELIDRAKAAPGTITIGNAGIGSSNQLFALALEDVSQVRFNHVAYRGGGPLINDLLGGHLDCAFSAFAASSGQVLSGSLKAIAVGSDQRLQSLPKVPTISETYPGFAARSWFGMLVPAGTPAAVVNRLHGAVAETLKEPHVLARLNDLGIEGTSSRSPVEFNEFIRSETAKFEPLIAKNASSFN